MTSSRSPRNSPAGGELSGLLHKAEVLHKELDRAQGELKEAVVEGSDASGRVLLRVNGEGTPLAVKLNLASLEPAETRALEDALTVALRGTMERLFATLRDARNRLDTIRETNPEISLDHDIELIDDALGSPECDL